MVFNDHIMQVKSTSQKASELIFGVSGVIINIGIFTNLLLKHCFQKN